MALQLQQCHRPNLEEQDDDNIQITCWHDEPEKDDVFLFLLFTIWCAFRGWMSKQRQHNDQFLEGYDIIDVRDVCMSGTKPVDQFCWIRIRHPSTWHLVPL